MSLQLNNLVSETPNPIPVIFFVFVKAQSLRNRSLFRRPAQPPRAQWEEGRAVPGPLVPMLSLPEGGLCVTLGNERAPLNLFPLWEKGVCFLGPAGFTGIM